MQGCSHEGTPSCRDSHGGTLPCRDATVQEPLHAGTPMQDGGLTPQSHVATGLVGGLTGCRQQPSLSLLPPRGSFSCLPGQHKEGSVALKIPSATAGQDRHSQAIRHSRAGTWHGARAEPGAATQDRQTDRYSHSTKPPTAHEPEVSRARAAHLHGQEILLVRQDAVGVHVFLEPVAAERASGCWGLGGVPPPASPKGMPSTLPVRPLLHQHRQ